MFLIKSLLFINLLYLKAQYLQAALASSQPIAAPSSASDFQPLVSKQLYSVKEDLLKAESKGFQSNDCLTNSLDYNSLYCRGSRAIRNVINNLNKSEKPIVIIRGLEIVRSNDFNSTDQLNSMNLSENENPNTVADDSFLGRFSQYLRTHELKVKFSDLLAEEQNAASNRQDSSDQVEARKKDKGMGTMMAVAMMFGKMMAVMGLGSVGAMAMKALGVAMMALMMAGMVGMKQLAQHGHESSHSVQYVTADGHHIKRRRRSLTNRKQLHKLSDDEEFNPLPLVYRGWSEQQRNSGKA